MLWPQDILINPQSYRRNIDPVLSELTDREFFSYTDFRPLLPTTANITQEFVQTMVVEQNFNFWLANIEVLSFNTVTGAAQSVYPGMLEVVDNETGRRFIRGALASFQVNLVLRGARNTSSKPYVIRAGQSFTATLKVPPLTAPLSTQIQLSFEGWKDYSY